MSRTVHVLAGLLLLSIGFAAGYLLGKGQAVPEPPVHQEAPVAPLDKTLEALGRLRARLVRPDSLRVLKVNSNAHIKADTLWVEIEFEAEGNDGRPCRSSFWVRWQGGRPEDHFPEHQEILGADGRWTGGDRNDPCGLFKASL